MNKKMGLGSKLSIVALFTGMKVSYAYGTYFTKNITVNDKFIVVSGDRDGVTSTLVISDTNGEIYKVGFSLWYWNWFVPETYTRLEKGKNYTVSGYGWRFPFPFKFIP